MADQRGLRGSLFKPQNLLTQLAAREFVLFPSLLSHLALRMPSLSMINLSLSTTLSAGAVAGIGKTIQRLEARIKQHIPAYVLEPGKNAKKKTTKQKKEKENNQKEEEERSVPDSAIGEHLVPNVGCLNAYDRKQFAILTVARTQSKLDTLEVLFIKKF